MTDRPKPKDRPEIPDLVIETAPQRPQTKTAGTSALAKWRKNTSIRVESIISADAQPRGQAVRTFDQTINNGLASETSEPHLRRLFGSRHYLTQVLSLNHLFDKTLDKLEHLERILKINHVIDPTTSKPALSDENLEQLLNNLRLASLQTRPQKQTSGVPENNAVFKPDSSLLKRLRTLNEQPHLFLEPTEVSAIIKAIDDFLQGIIEYTVTGIIANMGTLNQTIETSIENTNLIQAAKRFTDEMNLDADPETVQAWHDLIRNLEFALSHFMVKMEKIFGPNAAWLLSKVEIKTLQRTIHELDNKANQLTEQIYDIRHQDQNPSASIIANIRKIISGQGSRPAAIDRTKLRNELTSVKEQRSYLKKLLGVRIKMQEEKQLITPDLPDENAYASTQHKKL